MSNEPEQPDPDEGRLDAAIERVVKKTFGALLDSGRVRVEDGRSGGKNEAPQVDVAAQVKQAVKDAQAEDRRSAAEKEKDNVIAELQARLAAQEQRPREHRPITSLMGWVDRDDVK